MSWIYHQRSRQLEHNGRAYTRARQPQPEATHAVRFEAREGHAPLPHGRYRISAPYTDAHSGSFTLQLTPSVTNHALQRNGYLIHGPEPAQISVTAPGSLVLPLPLRRLIWTSGDRSLEVVA